jgi:hypothetical protein
MRSAFMFQQPLDRRAWIRACAGLMGSLCGLRAVGAEPGVVPEQMPWPTQLELLDAPALSAAQLTVLVFFSLSCPYCRRHNQRLSALALQAPGLRVLGAALDSDLDALRQYRNTQGLKFAITPDAQALRERVTRRRVIPFTAVAGSDGAFLERIPGEMSDSDILGLARWATKGA